MQVRGQPITVERRTDQGHSRQHALGEKFTVLIDHHEATVPDEPKSVVRGVCEADAAERLYGINKQLGEKHGD